MDITEVLPQPVSMVLGDGNTYTFGELYLNDQVLLEEKYRVHVPGDESAQNGLQNFLNKFTTDPSAWRFMGWLLLRRQHKELTVEKLGELIPLRMQVAFLRVCMEQFVKCLPPELATDEKKMEMINDFHRLTDPTGVSSSPTS